MSFQNLFGDMDFKSIGAMQLNPKFKEFKDLSKDDTEVDRLSVLEQQLNNQGKSYDTYIGDTSVRTYTDFVYGAVTSVKPVRLQNYRRMAQFPEVGDAIDEISDTCVNYDDNDRLVHLKVRESKIGKVQLSELEGAFDEYMSLFELDENIFDYVRTFIIEGQLAWENIVDDDDKEAGIVGVNYIPTESYDFLVNMKGEKMGISVITDNSLIGTSRLGTTMQGGLQMQTAEDFMKSKEQKEKGAQSGTENETVQFSENKGVPLPWEQVTYCDSGSYNPNKLIVYPVLERARKAFRQLSLIEDVIIIYRLARAPVRYVFNVDTGDLNRGKAEQEVYKMMRRYQTKQFYNPETGSVSNTYNPHSLLECLALDTKIPLLDGRTLTLNEIIAEFEQGKKLWAYSADPKTGKFAPGLISWAGVTRRNTELVKVTFDNGKSVICTPDHRFPIWGKGDVEAQDLQENDSAIAFNRRLEREGEMNNSYEQVFDHERQEWVYTHHVVADTCRNDECSNMIYDQAIFEQNTRFSVRHHIDRNRLNNSPENLAWMTWKDHYMMHGKNAYVNNVSDEKKTEMYAKVSETLKQTYKDNPEILESHSRSMKEAWKRSTSIRDGLEKHNLEYWADTSACEHLSKKMSLNSSEKLFDMLKEIIKGMYADSGKYIRNSEIVKIVNSNADFKSEYAEINRDMRKFKIHGCKIHSGYLNKLCIKYGMENLDNVKRAIIGFPCRSKKIRTKLVYTESMLKRLVDIVKAYSIKFMNTLIPVINTDEEFKKIFFKLNSTVEKIAEHHIKGILRQFNYLYFSDFLSKCVYHNHRVLSVERLPYTADTGTLTIDQDHKYHDYHNFAVDAGIYLKNSFWFPKPSGSGGTTVSTLDTPTSLWTELPDLEYFLKKLYRSLKVPFRRYKEAAVNVEKGPNITYEEYKFAKFVMRILDRMAAGFKYGYKQHLKLKGLWERFDMDDQDFVVKFTPPAMFDLYEQQKILEIKFKNYDTVTRDHPEMSKRLAMKKCLGYTDEYIDSNFKNVEEESIILASIENKTTKIKDGRNPYVREESK